MDGTLQPDRTQRSNSVRFEDIRRDPFRLDTAHIEDFAVRPKKIVTNEPFAPIADDIAVHLVSPPEWPRLRSACTHLHLSRVILDGAIELTIAARLIREMRDRHSIAIVGLHKYSAILFCLANALKGRERSPVLGYRILMPGRSKPLKTRVMGFVLSGVTMVALWSRAQIDRYCATFGWPQDKFIQIPYKSNHSKSESRLMPIGDYIFSGGNSERDYRTLFNAVRGLPIPVIVSATRAEVLRGLAAPENVIVVKAEEPAFERLMAGSRLVAISMNKEIARAAGEATALNAMWHGKPVVVADDVWPREYINEGEDGFIVAAGDAETMRRRILDLWENPQLAAQMGEAGHRKVSALYTHDQFKTRMQILAILIYNRAVEMRKNNPTSKRTDS